MVLPTDMPCMLEPSTCMSVPLAMGPLVRRRDGGGGREGSMVAEREREREKEETDKAYRQLKVAAVSRPFSVCESIGDKAIANT